MKKATRLLSVVFAAAMVLILLCACGGSSIVGTWYCADDVDGQEPMTLTSDGKFNWDGVGGEYSYENGQVVLVSSWGSEILSEDRISGKTCLVDDEGGIWFNSRKAAQKYYKQETEKKFSAVESLCYGTFSFDDENDRMDSNKLQLVLNKNHTYKYIYKGSFDDRYSVLYINSCDELLNAFGGRDFDAKQSGTWALDYEGTLLDGYVCIKFYPEESSGYDNATFDETFGDWIVENKPAPFTHIVVTQNGLEGWTKN